MKSHCFRCHVLNAPFEKVISVYPITIRFRAEVLELFAQFDFQVEFEDFALKAGSIFKKSLSC